MQRLNFKNIVWIYLHDKTKTKEVVETLFPKSPEELALLEEIKSTKITLLNGSGKSSKFNTAKKLLKSVKESPAKEDKGKKKEHKKEERPRIKQKIQKKGAEPKPIKKPSASPIELYEI